MKTPEVRCSTTYLYTYKRLLEILKHPQAPGTFNTDHQWSTITTATSFTTLQYIHPSILPPSLRWSYHPLASPHQSSSGLSSSSSTCIAIAIAST